MKIHFVCHGNTFRSRLAEAYLRYILRRNKDIVITSSGIHADMTLSGPISWYGMKLIDDHELVPFMSHSCVRTSEEILNQQDKIYFMDESSLLYCKRKFHNFKSDYETWEIEDIFPKTLSTFTGHLEKDIYILKKTKEIYCDIKRHCDRIAADLSLSEEPLTPWNEAC